MQGYACHVLGSQVSPESHFLSKIWSMNFPFLWVKIFSNCKFLGFSSVIPQNKFLAVKFMTKIGQHKTAGNYFQKLKSLESSECWPKPGPKLYIVKLQTAYADPSSYEIVTHIFG